MPVRPLAQVPGDDYVNVAAFEVHIGQAAGGVFVADALPGVYAVVA